MSGPRHRPFASGSRGSTYRRSRKRLKRITVVRDTPVEFWIVAVLTLLILVGILTWLIKHPPKDHDEPLFGYDDVTATVTTA